MIFCALASVNLTFDALHVARVWALHQPFGFDFFRDYRFSIVVDRGFAEQFEYAVSALTAAALFGLAWRSKVPAYLVLALAHCWLALDNAFKLHEQIGEALRDPSQPFAASVAVGEAAYFAVVGIVGAASLFVASRTTPDEHRRTLSWLTLGLMAIGVFAVGIDALHATDLWRPLKETVVILLEDGGEALALSANLALTASVFIQPAAAAPQVGRTRFLGAGDRREQAQE